MSRKPVLYVFKAVQRLGRALSRDLRYKTLNANALYKARHFTRLRVEYQTPVPGEAITAMIVAVALHGRWPVLNSSMGRDRSMRPWRMQTMSVAMSLASPRS